ncbi:MAG: hypothetical protein U0931_10625 [Vulcanimicrobiota bacterium]
MRKKGLALITTLMVMSLLLTLIGAFIQVERANHRLTGNALERRAAQDACLTALSIAWSNLEENPSWGTTANFSASPPTPVPLINPIARIERRLVGAKKILHGVVQAEGDFEGPSAVTFDLTIYNNLSNPKVDPSGDYSVPARSCRLTCVATCGSSVRRMDTILRQVPISYDSLVAKKKTDLASTTGLVRLESRDPYVNRMRAGTDMGLPSASNVQFLKGGSSESNRLFLSGTNQSTDSQLDAASHASGGNYLVGQGPPTIPTFDPENFKLPNDPNKVSTAAAGSYHYGGYVTVTYHAQQLNWTDPGTGDPNANPPKPDDSGTCTRYQRESSTYDQLTDAEGRVWFAKNARQGSTQLDPPNVPSNPTSGTANSWGYDAPGTDVNPAPTSTTDIHQIYPGVWTNVVTAQMAIQPGYKVECPGPFLVSAEGNRQPEMLFGYEFTSGGVAVEKSLDDGLDAALKNPEKYMAALVADGSVAIPGGALGYGSMIAGGDMTVKASSGLRAAPQLGVVVKARNLTIEPATEPEPQLPGEPVSMDYPVFKDAINTYAGGNWAQFDNWLTQTGPQRASTTQAFKTTVLSQSPSTYWNQLNTELKTNFPVPSFGPGWGSTTTIEQYVRMKEYIQTLAAKYDHGNGDPSWIDMTQHNNDAEARLSNMVSTMAQWAKSYQKSLQAYLANPAAQVPDMFYQGLLYADGDLTINAPNKSFRLEGSAMAGGNALLNGARSLDLVYDRELVDSQLKTNHTVNGNRDHLRLEKIFFSIQ